MRSQHVLAALVAVFARGVLSVRPEVRAVEQVSDAREWTADVRDPENIMLEKDTDPFVPVSPGLPARDGDPRELNESEQESFDEAVKQGNDMGRTWSYTSLVVAVLLCGGWMLYPVILAFLFIPVNACQVFDCSVLSFWGSYAPAPVQPGENEEVIAAEGGEPKEGGDEAEAEDEGAEWDEEETGETKEDMILRRRKIVFMEVLMSYVQTAVVVVIWGAIAAYVGPVIAQANVLQQSLIFIPPIIRIMRVESRLTDMSVLALIKKDITDIGQVMPAFPYMRTKGEVLDAGVDGMAMVVMFVLEYYDPLYKSRIDAAYGTDPFGYVLAPLSAICGLSGLLLILNLVAYTKQIVACLMRANDHGWLACDTAGMGGLAHMIKFKPGDSDIELKHMGRSLYEGIPQMIIQSYGIIGTGRGLTDNPVMGLAMAFGIVMITWRASVLLRIKSSPRFPIVFGTGLMMLGVVVYLCVKVFLAETCHSLMFSLMTWECVAAPTAI